MASERAGKLTSSRTLSQLQRCARVCLQRCFRPAAVASRQICFGEVIFLAWLTSRLSASCGLALEQCTRHGLHFVVWKTTLHEPAPNGS